MGLVECRVGRPRRGKLPARLGCARSSIQPAGLLRTQLSFHDERLQAWLTTVGIFVAINAGHDDREETETKHVRVLAKHHLVNRHSPRSQLKASQMIRQDCWFHRWL